MQFVYKYRAINEYTLKTILDREIYFAKPSEFNDPFDSRSNIIYEGGHDDWYKFAIRIGRPHEEANSFADRMVKLKITKLPEEAKKVDDENNRIYSLSKIPDNIIMWSHYAEQHNGICLKFETCQNGNTAFLEFEEDDFKVSSDKFPKGLIPILPVEYENEMPVAFNMLKDPPNEIMRFVLHKNESWAYEKEIRAILMPNWMNKNPIRFKRHILKEVIFGLRISETYKRLIADIIARNYTEKGCNVKLSRCIEATDKYSLIIEEF